MVIYEGEQVKSLVGFAQNVTVNKVRVRRDAPSDRVRRDNGSGGHSPAKVGGVRISGKRAHHRALHLARKVRRRRRRRRAQWRARWRAGRHAQWRGGDHRGRSGVAQVESRSAECLRCFVRFCRRRTVVRHCRDSGAEDRRKSHTPRTAQVGVASSDDGFSLRSGLLHLLAAARCQASTSN